jgi:hypothetical protein
MCQAGTSTAVGSDKKGHSGQIKERVMKKIILVLVLLALVMPAFADEATVLPAGVLRTYIVPVYSFATEAYDEDGETMDITLSGIPVDKVSLFNLGGAIEYGVNDWISAAVQWTPGQTFTTKFDIGTAAGPLEEIIEEDLTAKGPAEVFIGAKFQFVGPKAPVVNDMFRVAAAAGAMVPAAFGYDAEEEFANFSALTGGTPTATNVGVGKNALGFGGRFYADYVVNEMFFFNLYSQFKYFLPVAKEKTDVLHYFAALLAGADEVNYGYELTLEAEPHFDATVADGVILKVGLPVTYVMTPDIKFDDTESADSATSSLYVKPSVTAFMMKLPLPMEFKLGYEYPLMGKNTFARNNVARNSKLK